MRFTLTVSLAIALSFSTLACANSSVFDIIMGSSMKGVSDFRIKDRLVPKLTAGINQEFIQYYGNDLAKILSESELQSLTDGEFIAVEDFEIDSKVNLGDEVDYKWKIKAFYNISMPVDMYSVIDQFGKSKWGQAYTNIGSVIPERPNVQAGDLAEYEIIFFVIPDGKDFKMTEVKRPTPLNDLAKNHNNQKLYPAETAKRKQFLYVQGSQRERIGRELGGHYPNKLRKIMGTQ